jgi:hypothetical protein
MGDVESLKDGADSSIGDVLMYIAVINYVKR